MDGLCKSSFRWEVYSIALAAAFGLFGAVSAAGQTAPLGTLGARSALAPKVSTEPVNPFKTYENASYGTGGIALRNRGRGVLHVSGVSGPVQAAYLYWAILFKGTAPGPALFDVELRPITLPYGDYVAVSLKGTLLGIGADPCWGSSGIAVFRAAVPNWVAKGNGAYEVILANGASGLTDGSDPWVKQAFPEAEGASLVIVGTGAYTVSIYDAGFTATTFYTVLNYTLNLPIVSSGQALWDNIGADGQAGDSRSDSSLNSLKITSINDVQIAGPGISTFRAAFDNDSDWNGSAGLPIPQLWDDTGHDITLAVAGSSTASVNFEVADDCLCTVFNVLALK